MAAGIDHRTRELWVHLGGAEMTIAGQRRREARGNNADLNFTASSCSGFSRICVIPQPREDSEGRVQAIG
jgi:hypothetical protein